jgi:hypothetical protein
MSVMLKVLKGCPSKRSLWKLYGGVFEAECKQISGKIISENRQCRSEVSPPDVPPHPVRRAAYREDKGI